MITRIIKIYTQLLGLIFLGVILHELYHWVFAKGASKACYVAGKGFAVYSQSGTSEIIPYILLFTPLLIGILTMRGKNV